MKKCKNCKHWKPTVDAYKGGCRKIIDLMKYNVEYPSPISVLIPLTDHKALCDHWEDKISHR